MPTIWYGVHQPISAAKAAAKGWNTINLDSAEEARECADAYWDAADENDAPSRVGRSRDLIVQVEVRPAQLLKHRQCWLLHNAIFGRDQTSQRRSHLGDLFKFALCAGDRELA
jgi:hypothetical protein